MKDFKVRIRQFPITQIFITTAYVIPVAIVTGLVVALFLWLLDLATTTRQHNMWLMGLLPLAGVAIYLLYSQLGKNSAEGNNLIIDEIHSPGGGIPFRMAPLVLFSTIITHLFGGSAGREGTAVQIGGSISAVVAKWLKINAATRQMLLICGIAAGFGAVFGTPVTGTIFAIEVLAIGQINYNALIPSLIAAVIADATCKLTGIQHTHYSISSLNIHSYVPYININLALMCKAAFAGICFGLISWVFAQSSHRLKAAFTQYIRPPWLIPVLGGILVIAIPFALGTFDYNGLGVTSPSRNGISILSAFKVGGSNYFSWFWKLLLTVVTLSTGFKGGEVTPLFFIGATLGNTIAIITGAPIDLMAGLGLIAVFAGATNTPIACTLMGVELFGGEYVLYYAIACFVAYHFSGHSGIYKAQRIANRKILSWR